MKSEFSLAEPYLDSLKKYLSHEVLVALPSRPGYAFVRKKGHHALVTVKLFPLLSTCRRRATKSYIDVVGKDTVCEEQRNFSQLKEYGKVGSASSWMALCFSKQHNCHRKASIYD